MVSARELSEERPHMRALVDPVAEAGGVDDVGGNAVGEGVSGDMEEVPRLVEGQPRRERDGDGRLLRRRIALVRCHAMRRDGGLRPRFRCGPFRGGRG